MKDKIRYLLKNWKIGIHLLFRTKRFGVNNDWWVSFDSIFGVPTRKIIYDIIRIRPIIFNYKCLKYRAGQLGFMEPKNYKLIFGEKI